MRKSLINPSPVGWAHCAHEDVDLYNTMVGNELPTLLVI